MASAVSVFLLKYVSHSPNSKVIKALKTILYAHDWHALSVSSPFHNLRTKQIT